MNSTTNYRHKLWLEKTYIEKFGNLIKSKNKRYNVKEVLHSSIAFSLDDIPYETRKYFKSEYWRDIKRMIPQLKKVTKLLNEEPNHRGAIIMNWRLRDLNITQDEYPPPCIVCLHFILRDNVLFVSAMLRSCDVAGKLENDIKFIKHISKRVQSRLSSNPKLGELEIWIGSSHIYE